ncbi:MAG TPA: HAMP domain-containing sensor histidine kinase [Jatrophihabitans sp.]|jgi:signal transduction histidine kinase
MSDIDSSPARRLLGAGWLLFATVNAVLMYLLPGEETIPYHLIWASFAFVYGLIRWSKPATWIGFWGITVVTGIAMVRHASSGVIGWEECSEIVLMGVLVALLIWHVNRQRAAQDDLALQAAIEAQRNRNREVTAQFGSHEVRTRLTIARGFVELIKNGSQDARVRDDADLVLGELDKASTLATQLLTLVRVETPPRREPMDLDSLIDSVSRRWRATAVRRWSAASSVGVVLGDAERIEAALDCLIENAVKFTAEQDEIKIRAWRAHGVITMSVADSGVGIPAADLHRVLQVFQTGSSAGDRAGSGLGLAIVCTIAESRQGSVDVSSVEGEGTCFTLRFPTSPPAQNAPPNRAVPLAIDRVMSAGRLDVPLGFRTDREDAQPDPIR